MQNKNITSYMEATGVIPYNMTNDYMFRYVLQKNEKVLRGLICSLLHLHSEQIKTIQITNPISMSDYVGGKEFILDINVMLNDDTLLNLEMQVLNLGNWPERSLSYLCRSFDQLYRGQKYTESFPVTHIGFLDFTLFPNEPEFYSQNKMLNTRTHRVFSDKFTLSVIDLSQIELATDEDKAWGLDYWAHLFKAKTWEEIKMLAVKNEELKEALQEAAQTIYMANSDDMVRQRCFAREEAERRERTYLRDLKNMQEMKEALQEDIAALQEDNTALQEDNAALQEDNAALQKDNAALQEDNATLQEDNAKKSAYIAELEAKLRKANLVSPDNEPLV